MAASQKDSVIINELLFYIQNQIHATTKVALVETCVKFYAIEEINAAITTLEDAFSTRMSRRNNSDDVATKMINDIYDKIWSADATATPTPTFVAADLSRIPRARKDSDSFATTEQLLASLYRMKCRIDQLESKQVTRDFLDQSLCCLGERLLGSDWSWSPPPPPPPALQTPASPSAPSFSQMTNPVDIESAASTADSASTVLPPLLSASTIPTPSSSTQSSGSTSAPPPPLGSTASLIPEATPADGRRWEDAQSRRRVRKNTDRASNNNVAKRGGNNAIVIGKSVSAGVVSWKGADLTVARYVGRVAIGTATDTILSSLRDKGVEVVELTPLSLKHNRYLSFKLVVKKSQLTIIEDEQLWPEGVIIGRYWSPKSSSSSTLIKSNGSQVPLT